MSLNGHIGDVIEITARHVGESRRLGEILEVLGTPEHERYRVRWDDGRETLFYPGADAGIVRRSKERPAAPAR